MPSVASLPTAALSVLVIMSAGCSTGVSPVRQLRLVTPNPTSYDFDVPLPEVHACAMHVFDGFGVPDAVFGPRPARRGLPYADSFSVEDKANAVFGSDIFKDPANANDVYVFNRLQPLVASPVYRGRTGGLPFSAAFQIHIVARSANRTRVTVIAHDAKITTGQRFGLGSCGPARILQTERVEPTSIEEYEMLRYLAHALGVTRMPPPRVPSRS